MFARLVSCPAPHAATWSDLCSCSVACSKIHRENHPPEEERKPPPPAAAANEAQAKNNTHPFGVLDESKELQRLFTKYPNLKTKLKTIHDASLPGRDDNVLRNGPIRSNPHGKKPDLWTPEVGLRRSQQALRRARTDPGEDGDGVREYCELVVYLLSRAGERDATAIVRDEVAQEEQGHSTAHEDRGMIPASQHSVTFINSFDKHHT